MGWMFLLSLVAAAPPKVAVLDIGVKGGFDKDKAEVFNELVQKELRSHGYSVIGRSDVEALLGLERMKDALACDTKSCLAEIGGALGADEIVSGIIGIVDNYLVITLKRINPNKGAVLKQAVTQVDMRDGGSLLDEAPGLVAELYGWPAPPKPERARPPDPKREQGVRFTVKEEGDVYAISVKQGKDTLRCPEPVTKKTPCVLPVKPGKATVIADGAFEQESEFGAGVTKYAVKHRPRWPWLLGGGIVLAAGVIVATGVTYAIEPCVLLSGPQPRCPNGVDSLPTATPARVSLGVGAGLTLGAIVGTIIAVAVVGNMSSVTPPKTEETSRLRLRGLDLAFVPGGAMPRITLGF